MENRSNHVLVGGVVLTLVAVAVAFLVWISQVGAGHQNKYDIFFKTGVDGLAVGSAVAFSGVPVGKVDQIRLMPESPEFVRVRIAVDDSTPILQGTTASIAGVGFTGVSQINLNGAIRGAPPISEVGPFGVPVIPTKQGGLGALLNSAPALLDKLTTLTDRLGQLLDDRNQKSFANILANIDRLSSGLAGETPQIQETLAETRTAIRQAGEAAQQIAKLAGTTNQLLDQNGRPLMANLQQAIASAQHSMKSLDETITAAKPGIVSFSTQTAPNVDQLVRDLSDMAQALSAVANKLNSGGAGGVLSGGKLPDYKGK